MEKKHGNYLFPQWQGGGKKATYDGAMSLKKIYLSDIDYQEIPVDQEENLVEKNGIVGYDPIMRQLQTFADTLHKDMPDTLFVMGGGDDVDILPPAYCNALCSGDMSLMFFDAHGDLNSPQTSPSGCLHGMPLRAMLGDTDPAIRSLMDSTLKPEQTVMAGTRDCDPPEEDYIQRHHMTVIRSQAFNEDPSLVCRALKKKGHPNIFIHVDIDVIDPKEFAYQPVPAPSGIHEQAFLAALKQLQKEFRIVGMCILGYTAMPEGKDPVLEGLIETGAKLV